MQNNFFSKRRQIRVASARWRRGAIVLDGYSKHFLESVPVSLKTPLKKGHVLWYSEFWAFMRDWKDFNSPVHHAFGRFVESISHTFESGRRLVSHLKVGNINDTCVFAPPRVKQIWESDLNSVTSVSSPAFFL